MDHRVGVPWLGHTCGVCPYCLAARENLCDAPGFTGYTINGGYAEQTVADSRYCLKLPDRYDDIHAAPLLCAGLIGYRTLAMAGDAKRIGIYGFGAAAHIVAQGVSSMRSHALATSRLKRWHGGSARIGLAAAMSRRPTPSMPL